ncbi:MAG: hypothetical protein QHH14_01830 [Clostridiales bacterium]|nr:hypothetical protein [Clostridiales bacterium]
MREFKLVLFAFLLISAALKGEKIIILGQAGTEGELAFPRQVAEGPDRNIYIYDQADAFIKVYSPGGNFLRKIGGKGQGPGEIQRADGVTFGFTADSMLFFTEFFGGHPWITIVELDGKLNRVIKPQVKEFFGIHRAVSLAKGGFLVEFAFLGKPEKEKDYFYHRSLREIALLDAEGQILSRIRQTNHITRISYVHDGADSPIPYTPMFLWCPYDESSVLFSEGLETNIQVIDYSGKLARKIETSLPKPEKVTGKDLDEWKKQRREMIQSRDPDWWGRFGKVIEKYKKSIYPYKPTIWEINRTPQGNFLIAARIDRGQPRRGYWLMDGDGKQLIKVDTSAWIMGISPHFIFLGEVDEGGIPSIKALERQGREEDDLLNLRR